MAGVLGLGSSGSTSLNSELIEKLKEEDKASTVTPLEEELEKFTTEKEVIANIQTKVSELLSAVKVFSLNQSSGATAFNQKVATTSGDSVVFDADDMSALKTGFTTVEVTQLAKKDVYQSNIITDKSSKINDGTGIGTLTINGKEFSTTNKSYEDLAKEISKETGMTASVDQVGNGQYRLIIKSTDTGEDNALTIGGDASTALGYDVATNHVLTAQNMQATVDGVPYNTSSNTITVDGLKISASKVGISTANIEEDNSSLTTQMQSFVTAYNALNSLITDEVYNNDSSLGDKSAIKDVMSQLKEQLFGTGNGDKTIFSYGFSFDSSNGNLVLSTTEFESAIKNDKEGLVNLFTGVPEKKGIATVLDELISNNGISKNLIDYESNMLSRETKKTEQRDAAQEALDAKYELMAQQFAAYTTIITQMENSFSGLKLLIEQSTSSS